MTDTSFSKGNIALYAWVDQGAYFDEGTINRLSKWTIANDVLVQQSNIYSSPNTTADLAKLGTYAVYANLVEIPQSQMQVASVDSEELVGENGSADNVLDGDPNTIWHTEWYSSAPPCPHEIVIALGGSYHLGRFRDLSRQDGNMNGTVAQFSFHIPALTPSLTSPLSNCAATTALASHAGS